MKMEQAECPETSEYKIQTPGNYPEEIIQQFICCIWIHICNKGARIVKIRAVPEKAGIKKIAVLSRGINITPVLEDWSA